MLKINTVKLSKDIKKAIRTLRKLPKEYQGRAIKQALARASKPLIKVAKTNAPKADKPIIRYINGRPVAVYYPGNLRRSIGILRLKRTLDSVYVGPRVSTSGTKGIFRGGRYDPYYAHMIHNGTVDRAANPFLLSAFITTRQLVIINAGIEAKKMLDKYALKNKA